MTLRSSATEEVIAAINNERRRQSAVLEPWPHQHRPRFSAILIFKIALLCELALAVGFLFGWRLGR